MQWMSQEINLKQSKKVGGKLKQEIWKDIKGYEGIYQISNLERIKSLDKEVNCKNGFKAIKKGKILKLKIILL